MDSTSSTLSDLVLGVAFQPQHHGFYRLALGLVRQQPMQIAFALFPLLTTRELWKELSATSSIRRPENIFHRSFW